MFRRPKRRQRVISLFGLFALLAMMFAVPVSADHPGDPLGADVSPQFVEGNPTCSDLLDAGQFDIPEVKIEPVESGTYNLNGELDADGPILLTVRNTDQGQVVDFSLDGFLAMGVVVKGGPNANFYDYTGLGGVAFDEDLHAPVNHNNDRFFGLSHVSFCLIEAPAELEITKTAVESEISVGDTAAFDITVTSIGQISAENVVIDDNLPAGYDWEVASETTDGACDITADGDGNLTVLHCDVGNLAPDESFTVRVQTQIPAGTSAENAEHCDAILDNTAIANADNADEVSDDAQIDINCGGLRIVKTAKHADESGETNPNLAASFQITDSQGNVHTVSTEVDSGLACVGDLPLGDASVEEISAADGYAIDTNNPQEVTVTNENCGSGSEVTATFENQPLTDISWIVDSQVDGGTETTVNCWFGQIDGDPDFSATVSDGENTFEDLVPTDPDITLTCQFIVDP